MTVFVSLAEARAAINAVGDPSVDDGELGRVILTACDLVEYVCGPVGVTTVDEVLEGGDRLLLSARPVITITRIAPVPDYPAFVTPVPWDLTQLRVDKAQGIVYAGLRLRHRSPEYLTVQYTAGRVPVPEALKFAALVIVGHLWETQRTGGSAGASAFASDFPQRLAESTPSGFAVPNRAKEAMAPYTRSRSVA